MILKTPPPRKDAAGREDMFKVHEKMCAELEKHGVTLTKIYYCPHHESIKTCVCRKPSPYMVNLAIEEFHIDKKRSWFIGDSSKDVKCAEDAGVKPLRIHKNQDITPVIDQILKSKDSF